MDENTDQPNQEELDAWIKKQLDGAVRKSMKLAGMDSLIVEAKPAWVLPFQVLIGMIRKQGQSGSFDWCICGEVPTDFLPSSMASSPREAAKHFSMKWQLAAARNESGDGQDPVANADGAQQDNTGEQLIDHAEAVYSLVENDSLWLQTGNPND